MSKIFYNYKNKVIQKCFYKVTLGQAINIFLVKINLKVMKEKSLWSYPGKI